MFTIFALTSHVQKTGIPQPCPQAIEKVDLPPPWEKRRVRGGGDRTGPQSPVFREAKGLGVERCLWSLGVWEA